MVFIFLVNNWLQCIILRVVICFCLWFFKDKYDQFSFIISANIHVTWNNIRDYTFIASGSQHLSQL